ncbi:uncharacterized protein LOC135226419 [Macrobrachium nipponense]|uniref:uncharacterized protein LOC135226419 n=1 Tax=Macrobrachium nipponense TaxID=159736 RepID=UPI0030C7E7E4
MSKHTSSTRPNDKNYFDGQWLRKASMLEQMMDNRHKQGHFLVWYQLALKSKAPLQEEQVKRAVIHLYRRVPNLGVALAPREGTLWLKRATNPNVDFKVLQGQTVEEVRGILCAFRSNTETGPLFCARLLKDSPDKISDIDPEDLDPDLKHNYFMFFGFHHGVVDGTTCMYIMGFFISMLNDIISNRPINDDEPLGEYFPEDATVKLILRKTEMIESDSRLRDRLIQENEVQKNQNANITQISDKTSTEKRTVTLARVLSQDVTLKFIQKCRQEKVTVNSAFSALVAVALTDTLVEYGLVKDSYSVPNFHLVNLRRYWESKPPISLGCHFGGPLKIYTETPRNLGDNFWDYVRSLHQLIKDGIESEKVLTDKALHLLAHTDKEYEGDFVTSNLGNVTPLVTEGGEHVKITHIIQSTTIHCIKSPVVINLHTFRGKFTMMFDYNSGAVRKDIAEKYCSQILTRLFGILE